jgi:hypothetical protein
VVFLLGFMLSYSSSSSSSNRSLFPPTRHSLG